MSPSHYNRTRTWRRDHEDRRGQGVFAFAPGAAISTQQAAKMLGVCDETVRQMCEAGELEYFQNRPDVKGSPYRILKESVHRHMAKVLDRFALNSAPVDATSLPTATIRSGTPIKTSR